MEIREFAERVLLSPPLAEKLAAPATAWTDEKPGAPLRVSEPARTDSLRFAPKGRSAKMPHRSALREARLRAVAHHVMANHELQALEAMAWTLLAFPDAPPPFRAAVADVMLDEQRHAKMHIRRMRVHGLDFGDLPVNGRVWRRSREAEDVLDYVACLPLTFENANLDHTVEFAEAFARAGDLQARDVMLAIHADEIRHVALGVQWLRRLKPASRSDWEVYAERLRPPMRPCHAKGRSFQWGARIEAGMDEDFVHRLASLASDAPRGAGQC